MLNKNAKGLINILSPNPELFENYPGLNQLDDFLSFKKAIDLIQNNLEYRDFMVEISKALDIFQEHDPNFTYEKCFNLQMDIPQKTKKFVRLAYLVNVSEMYINPFFNYVLSYFIPINYISSYFSTSKVIRPYINHLKEKQLAPRIIFCIKEIIKSMDSLKEKECISELEINIEIDKILNDSEKKDPEIYSLSSDTLFVFGFMTAFFPEIRKECEIFFTHDNTSRVSGIPKDVIDRYLNSIEPDARTKYN